jgi:hypothetical protein
MPAWISRTLPLWYVLHALPLGAQTLCSSAGVAAPHALFERFTSADCLACWQDTATPAPGASALALDWMVPGTLGDDAPMAAAAVPEALDRLQTLQRPVPRERDIHTAPVEPMAGLRLRVGRGPEINGYVGATLSLDATAQGPWSYHLLLVQAVAQGTEGTPVPRYVVRNAIQGRWTADNALPASRHRRWIEVRPMRLPEGADPALFHTVAWVENADGRVVAAARSVCH